MSKKIGGRRQDVILARQSQPICPGRSSVHRRTAPLPRGIIPPFRFCGPIEDRGTLFAAIRQTELRNEA